jgi:hypothetical protein
MPNVSNSMQFLPEPTYGMSMYFLVGQSVQPT